MIIQSIKRVLHLVINKSDRILAVPSDYMHFIVNTSIADFFDFLFFLKLANHRKKLPRDAWHLARILSTQNVDCGTCVQITVNLALRDGMKPEFITATLDRKPELLPAELQAIYEFTGHILKHTYQEDELRESIRAKYGDRALIDLAYGIASAQVFPYTKQVLGFAKSCSKVKVQVARP